MNRIIVSGATGFVGVNLVPYLNQSGCQVEVLSRSTDANLAYKNLESKDLSKYNSFIHLAGKAHDLEKTSNHEDYFKVNFELTRDLFELFLDSECQKFIFFSSTKAVADTVNEVLTESHDYNPLTPYGQSKAMAEKYLLSQKIPSDKSVYILRPCMIHGPGNKGNLNLLYNLVDKGIPYPFGKYHNSRSYLSIDNLCFLIDQIIKGQNLPSGVYNLADDQSISTNEVVGLIGQTLGKNARIFNVPKFLIGAIAKLGDIMPLPIDSEKKKKLTENYVVSNYKIKKAFGLDVLPVNTSEGLIKTFQSFTSKSV
ncbi:NAD-dependent epimerase/dehydratase family protein [Nonlabens xiamenensis]|uniref:NAD-dependent epimerase/dehydratase family protein n=1 Tax=Nonlabens xiamenensis TaxID=2341043 RepID=UPI000F60D93C|nr:NAD-dependent epimerase/dehydratase family protein [Nonlabens xiamenensis]